MLKTLEKYKKYLLVVGGSLLMVAFIMPSAMSQMRGDPAKRVVAYLDGTKVRAKEYGLAHRELAALQRLAPLLLNNLGLRDDDLHWFLLTSEANKAGFVGAESDGEMFLQDMTELLAIQMAQAKYKQMAEFMLRQPSIRQELMSEAQKALPNFAANAKREAGLTDVEFFQALAKLRGVLRLEQSFMQAGRLSDRRLQIASKRGQEFIGVDTAVIPASRLIETIPDPSEAELAEHFAKYRDVNPGTGDNGIGYRQPDGVKVGWLFVDNLAVSDSIKVDPVEANKRWRKEYPAKPAEEFAKDRVEIEQTMRKEKVAAVMSQIDKIWRAQVLAATRRLEAEGAYKKLPENWSTTRPSLESIAKGIVEGVKAAMDINLPMPAVVIRDASWMSQRDLQRIPGFGQSMVSIGNQRGPAWQLAFTARELLESPTQAPPTGVAVQSGVPLADVFGVDASENRYYFMVIEARKAAAPASLAEVHDQVVKGFKTLKAYDVLVKDAEKYQAKALADGVEAVAKVFEIPEGTPPESDITPVQFQPKVLVSREQVGGSDSRLKEDAFRDAAVAHAEKVDPLKPVEDVPADQRTFTVALPKALSLAVGQVASLEPLTQERYRMVSEQLVRNEQAKEFESSGPMLVEQSPFSVAALKARLNFRSVADDVADRKPEEKKAPEGADGKPVEKAAK